MADHPTDSQPVLDNSQYLQDQVEMLSNRRRNSNTANPPDDLDDNTKYWLVVGICQHSILSPVLRSYVAPVLKQLYDDLRQSDNIDTQTVSNHLKTYVPSGKRLNYKTINNNKGAKHWGYNVNTPVDLSKLFLDPKMVQYTGFDSTCDLSPLLGIIINIDRFPTAVRNLAELVRKEVRNDWAHCKLNEWGVDKYDKSFNLMEKLVTSLCLKPTDETHIFGQLAKWQTNGVQFLKGTTIGLTALQEISRETSLLAEYGIHISNEVIMNISKVAEKIKCMEKELVQQKKMVFGALWCGIAIAVAVVAIGTFFLVNDSITQFLDPPFFYIPNQADTFVGHDTQLQQLADAFDSNSGTHFVQVLCGLGGIGKSTVAVEFAWRYRSRYPGGVLWVSGESDIFINRSLTQLTIFMNNTGKTEEETLHSTLKILSNSKQRWLLIVDNVDTEHIVGSIKEVIVGKWKQTSIGNILITTRRRPTEAAEAFHIQLHQCVPLELLSMNECINFMIKRTGVDDELTDNEHVSALILELGRLPLALEQAAAHIKVLECTFEEYLKLYKIERQRLLRKARSPTETSESRLSVTTTWQLNMDYIAKHAEEEGLGLAVTKVMHMACFLYPDDIPIELFSYIHTVDDEELRTAMKDPLRVKQTLEILSRFSLFKTHCLNGHKSNKACKTVYKISIHRLVQEAIRDSILDSKYKTNIIGLAFQLTDYANFEQNSSILPRIRISSYTAYKHYIFNSYQHLSQHFNETNLTTATAAEMNVNSVEGSAEETWLSGFKIYVATFQKLISYETSFQTCK